MKRHYRILILTDSEFNSKVMDFRSDRYSFIPGGRTKNYMELLAGFGIPYRIIDIRALHPDQCLKQDEIYYSAILFTSPIHNIRTDLFSFLTTYSFEYGVSLIADAFLITGKKMPAPFGLNNCSGLRLCIQGIRDKNKNLLYKAIHYPHSAKGFDIGIRPFLRFFLQSWFSRKIDLKKEAEPIAYYDKSRSAIVSCPFGKAVNYIFNFHPSLVLKNGNPMHYAIRNIFESNPHVASASFDLSNTACLRMDDPGSSERVHLEGYILVLLFQHLDQIPHHFLRNQRFISQILL